jgi:hypothetical protein
MSKYIDSICPICENANPIEVKIDKEIKLDCFCNTFLIITTNNTSKENIVRVTYSIKVESKINEI